MPANNIITAADGRYRYRYTDSAGQSRELRSRKGEGKRQFSRRCETAEEMAATRLGSDITFDELFRAWQEQYQSINCSLSDQRVIAASYQNHVRHRLGHLNISEITKSDILSLLTPLIKSGSTKATLDKIRQSISRPYAWAIEVLEIPLQNPMTGLRVSTKSRRSDEVRTVTADEWARFSAAAASTRYSLYYELLLHTGLRPSEGLGLQDSDIRGNTLQIRRGITRDGISALKTARAVRDIPISDQLRDILDRALAARPDNRAGWLFPGQHGRQPSMPAVESAFKRTAERAGTDFSLYDFRHTFATWMIEAGMPLKSLQLILGHSDIATTIRHYQGRTESTMRTAKAIMDTAFVPFLSRLGSAIVPETTPEEIKKAQ